MFDFGFLSEPGLKGFYGFFGFLAGILYRPRSPDESIKSINPGSDKRKMALYPQLHEEIILLIP